ncbi:MAG: helix-turn-helix domain-containing protein [Desulfosarcina sp.]|nr:helix-turn-helix domain-containing protein [Desulfosarcina sp.]
MERKEDLWNNELWTQSEVADYFRVVPGTVKNWREQGLLTYWQVPGSSKVLFYRDEIRDFRDKHTISKKGKDKPKAEIKKVKPSVSPANKEWRI